MKAKTIILLLTIVFISINSHAQTNVSYTYDSAGNRASRSIVVSRGEDGRWTEDSGIQLAEGIDTTSYKITTNNESVYDILSRIHYSDPEAERDYHAFYERVLADCKGYRTGSGIDTTCSIGKIPLTSGTTPTGAKTYSIAVPVAAGIQLTPSISLDYSSQAGNGPAGYGWSIGGLSSISIRNKSSYYDDVIAPADINNTSAAYSLDGIPLVTNDIAGLYSEGYTLQTTRGYIVVKKNVSSGVVTHFTALFPDGSKATYGWTSNTQNLASYPITEKTDILRTDSISFVHLDFSLSIFILFICFSSRLWLFSIKSEKPNRNADEHRAGGLPARCSSVSRRERIFLRSFFNANQRF